MTSDDKHVKILHNHDMDVSAQSTIRDERIPDLTFARWSQLDDSMDEACTTEFMGEFNIISRERKAIQAEFRQNEVEVDFRSKDDNDELDNIMQGMYRTDAARSRAKQCFKIAQDDAMDCGFGAWRIHTEETDPEDSLSTEKNVAFSPIPEAIRTVFFDVNSKLYDKSDAMRCSVRNSYTEDAYKQFLEDEGISEEEAGFVSFAGPYQSIYETYNSIKMNNPLYSEGAKEITLLEYYEVTFDKEWVYQYIEMDERGNSKIVAIPKKEAEAAENDRGEPLNKKRVEVRVCKKYISNGVKILKESIVPGGHIPIIPLYAERNFVEGVENFYGIVKTAKDPQKLYNATFNYLTSLMMYSPIPKPVYDEREIEGFEDDYDGANSHQLAYKRKHKYYKDENTGEMLAFPPEYTQPAQVPPAVAQLMQQLPALTDSILNPGVTEDSFNSNMSGVALQQVNEQIGIMRYIMLDNYNESMQRCAEVYAAMATETFDTPRKVIVTNANGTTAIKEINRPQFSMVLAKNVIQNEIEGAKFNIYSKVGPSYKSQRDAALGNLKDLYTSFVDPNDPMAKLVQLSILSQQDGQGIEEINKVARYQMLDMGLPGIEPQTEEEAQYVQMKQQQAAQQQQQDPTAQLAQAEAQARMMEGQAAMQNEQNDANKLLIDKQKVDNDTARVQIEAQKANVEVQLKAQTLQMDMQKDQIDMFDKQVTIEGKQIDNAAKMDDMSIQQASTDDLIRALG